MKTKLLFHSFLVLVLLFSISSCKRDEDDEKDCTPWPFSGAWMGTWESTKYGNTGTFTAFITQDGTALIGFVTIPEIYMDNAPLQGSVCRNEISFGDVDGTITFSGAIENDSVASGTYRYPDMGDKGTWEGFKMPEGQGLVIPSDTIECPLNVTSNVDPANGTFMVDAASDGNFFYVLQSSKVLYQSISNVIYKIQPDGTIVDSLKSPVEYPVGLAMDGTQLIVADEGGDNGILFRLNGMEPITVSLPSLCSLRDITNDGVNLWILDASYVYKQNVSGDVLYSFLVSEFNTEGLACDGNYL